MKNSSPILIYVHYIILISSNFCNTWKYHNIFLEKTTDHINVGLKVLKEIKIYI
jgi:hypothetical protein